MAKKIKKVTVPHCSECESFKSSMFCSVNITEEKSLSDNKVHNLFKKGQIVFYEGQQSKNLFCIFSGKVKISKMGDDGKEQIVRFAKKGDVIGYRALLSGEKYFASASVIEDAIICWFPKNIIDELLDKNPKFSMQTIKLLSKDLRIAEQIILNMAQKPVRNRLAEVLLMLKEYYGIDEQTHTINTTLSREEIANIAGTSTESCIRILSEFNNDGVIKIIGKNIKIENIPKLLQIANITE
jgi:CRP/FNR family transcriptional regulator